MSSLPNEPETGMIRENRGVSRKRYLHYHNYQTQVSFALLRPIRASLSSMRRTLFAIAALALLFTACNKTDEDINNVPDKGIVRFKNTSGTRADLYRIFLDDFKYGELFGGDSASFPNITAGSHRVKAEQIGNVVGTAKLLQQVIIVRKDSVAIFSFP